MEADPRNHVVVSARSLSDKGVVDGEEELAVVASRERSLDLRVVELGAWIGVVVAEREVLVEAIRQPARRRRAAPMVPFWLERSRLSIVNDPGPRSCRAGSSSVTRAEAGAAQTGEILMADADGDRATASGCEGCPEIAACRAHGDRRDPDHLREEGQRLRLVTVGIWSFGVHLLLTVMSGR